MLVYDIVLWATAITITVLLLVDYFSTPNRPRYMLVMVPLAIILAIFSYISFSVYRGYPTPLDSREFGVLYYTPDADSGRMYLYILEKGSLLPKNTYIDLDGELAKEIAEQGGGSYYMDEDGSMRGLMGEMPPKN